jgi:hypothetical protein
MFTRVEPDQGVAELGRWGRLQLDGRSGTLIWALGEDVALDGDVADGLASSSILIDEERGLLAVLPSGAEKLWTFDLSAGESIVGPLGVRGPGGRLRVGAWRDLDDLGLVYCNESILLRLDSDLRIAWRHDERFDDGVSFWELNGATERVVELITWTPGPDPGYRYFDSLTGAAR